MWRWFISNAWAWSPARLDGSDIKTSDDVGLKDHIGGGGLMHCVVL